MTDLRLGPGGTTGVGAIQAVRAGRLSPQEIIADARRRMAEWEPWLGAVAESVDRLGHLHGVLSGIVIGVKDQIDMAGHAHPIVLMGGRPSPIAAVDAPVVGRLVEAGASIISRTASARADAPGGVTPQTRNPRNPDRLSGGSSGGSAAAVAAGIVHVGLGSDSGGSIRIPAAACGVVGLNPTRGMVPMAGTGGLTYSIGSVGPLAATVADVRIVLAAIAERAPVGREVSDRTSAGRLRIGIPAELMSSNIDPDVRSVFEDVMAGLSAAGHHVETVSIPDIDSAMELGPRIVGVVEVVANLEDEYPAALGTRELAPLVEAAKRIPASGLARAYHRIAEFGVEVERVLSEFDVLITPTLPCRVPSGDGVEEEAAIEVNGVNEARTTALTRFVNPWNLAGVPAGSLPVGRDSQDGPISVQVIGPAFGDWKVLDVMALIEGSVGGPWDTVPPPA